MTLMSASPPEFSVRFRCDGSAIAGARDRVFLRRSGFQVDRRAIEEPFSSYFTPDLADLVDVALAVYTADRLCPRRVGQGNHYDHYWHRKLHVEVAVRASERWQDKQVVMRLRDLLVFMTEDEWDFRFTPRNEPSREVQGYLFDTRPADPATAALFSGGLDSLAGLCTEAGERPCDAFILFSGWTNARLASCQRRLASALAGRVGSSVISIRGSQNARSAHPVALAKIAELVELVSGRRFRIRLPFLFRTKADLCAGISEAGLRELIAVSVSCDGFPRRVKGKPQCGTCTSCLLCRQALHVAGLSSWDPADRYSFTIEQAHREEYPYELHAMLDQAWGIRGAVARHDPWSGLSSLYPELEATVCDLGRRGWDMEDLRSGIVALFIRYGQDWAEFEQSELPLFSSTLKGGRTS